MIDSSKDQLTLEFEALEREVQSREWGLIRVGIFTVDKDGLVQSQHEYESARDLPLGAHPIYVWGHPE